MFVVTTLSIAATAAWGTEYGSVVSSTPIVVAVPVQQQECSDQPVEYRQPSTGAGALIGGIAGAAIGNSLGGGFGRAAATGLGLVAGAAIGNQAEANSRPPVSSLARQCRAVTHYENRTTGYDVVYEYQGVRRRTQLTRDPGDRVALEVNVAPAEAGPLPQPVYAPRAPIEYQPPPQTYYPPASYGAPYYAAPSAYYYPAPYYVNPWPVVSVGIGFGGGWGGHRHGR
jgi:uncharacterized protein YcfJ